MEVNTMEKEHPEVIDLREVAAKIWAARRLFLKTLPTAFVLACIYIIGIPRYYTAEAKLAPEMESAGAGGALSSMASSLGFDIGGMQTSDAITPLLYPDLMEDNGFVTSMFDIKVVSQDGTLTATYHDYIQRHQQQSWWSMPMRWVRSLLPKKAQAPGAPGGFDPYYLSKNDDDIANVIRDKVAIDIDKKTDVITILVKDQDPYISKTLADSIKERLQLYITNYRTNKARTDYEYYKTLATQAKHEYERVRQQYASLQDANTRVVLKSVELKMEDMENDMQLKFNTYTTMNTQLQAAKAKVQERTPAFTVIKGAAVPLKPAGPKRMIFVLAMLMLTFMGTAVYIIRDDLLLALKAK